MSRSQQAKARMAARKEFGSPVSGGAFGGFAAAQSMSGLGYLVVLFDFSRISDANAIVLFKNLLKKDSTTRERALEELVQYVRAHPYENGGVEEAILEAWAQLYARLSIDDSRRVRELSHSLLLELMKAARKRMERQIPSIVGPWLAGTFDRDRGVARAASEGLSLFLNTPEKHLAFWKRCQSRILNYATAALKEKPTTLSDMRISTKEEADLKYYRVVCGSLSLVSGLLQILETADIDADRDDYNKLFAVDAIWRGALSKDSHVRKAAYDLFSLCLEKKPDILEPFIPRLTKLMQEEAPGSDQTGSIVSYVKALTLLSRADTAFWGKETHPLIKLKPLLEKGSQGTANTSLGSFWQQLEALFETLPERSISADQANEVLVSFRRGVSNRDDAQSNVVNAWTVYLSTVRRLVDIVSPAESRVGLVESGIHPLFEHFLRPPDKSIWRSGAQAPVIERACLLCSRPVYPDIVDATRNEWAKLSDAFSKRLANSLPEVSKEYSRSQEDISREGERWFSILGKIHRTLAQIQMTSSNSMNLVEDVLKQPTLDLLYSAIDLLEKRNYKPYGAANLISAAFSLAPHILQGGGGQTIVESIFPIGDTGKLSLLLSSPSASQLLQCLRALAGIPEFYKTYESVFYAVTSVLFSQQDASAKGKSITILIGNAPEFSVSISRRNVKLQEYLESSALETAWGKASLWDLLEATFTTNVLEQDRGKLLVCQIVHGLGSSGTDGSSMLRSLELIARHSPQLLSNNDELQLELVAKLLGFMEIQESPLSSQASRLRSLIDGHATKEPHLAKIIQEALDMAGPDSLEVDTLVTQAAALEKTASIEEKEGMCPSTNIWLQSMAQFLEARLSPALSITSRLGGVYLLVSGEMGKARKAPKRDRHGLSIPARMAEYTTKRLRDGFDMLSMPNTARRVESICLLYLVAELGSDQISTTDKDSLWGDLSDTWAMSTAEEAVMSIHQELAGLSKDERYEETYTTLIDTMLQQARQITPLGLYTARSLSQLLQVRVDSCGSSVMSENDIVKLGLWKSSPETALGALGVLTGYGELLATSKTVSNFCNRLISDVADAKKEQDSTLLKLTLLNACMTVYDTGKLPTATNRLVFAVKQILSWFNSGSDDEDGNKEKEEASLDGRLAAESCKALQRLLPCIKDMYGSHWEISIKLCVRLWKKAAHDNAEARLPYLHSSLKLISALKTMEEPNDDLEDALQLFSEAIWKGLLDLFELSRSRELQAQDIMDGLLCRMTRNIPLQYIDNVSHLYGLLASGSREIQTAGFNILHRAIPSAQAELSMNAILEKKEAQLPEELLSLLQDAPSLETYPDDVLSQFPTPVRSYLLSWHLVFDAFSKASAKVRNDYAGHLGKSNLTAAFLDFVFDVLGHSAARPLSLEKARLDAAHITGFDLAVADGEVEEHSMDWLMVHLYYLCLKYVPGLFRAWYANCRSKQTKVAVEAWTAKYFSAILISEILDEVAEWSEAQEPEDEEKELLVKVSKTSKEVVAGYEVDELEASISIRMPNNYPIDGVTVTGNNRVAVDEKKWQSWLMITQGVITFSNGSIIDGLATFRRNVVGALKGQSECAICYSIISSDKKMPDKRCGTCKNLFHKTCLYKWFQTSNQNTCPLCRNPISFLGADSRVRRGGRGYED